MKWVCCLLFLPTIFGVELKAVYRSGVRNQPVPNVTHDVAPTVGASGSKPSEDVKIRGSKPREDGNSSINGRRMQLTTAWRNAILNRHNEYRRETTDPCTATNMIRLEWDDNLQQAAQDFSEGCINANDPDNDANDWGENLGMSYVQSGDPPEITQAEILRLIGTWYNEIADVDWFNDYTRVRPIVYQNPGTQCATYDSDLDACNIAHYTQLVLWSVTRVGCGVTRCETGLSPTNNGGILLVCKYNQHIVTTNTGQVAPYTIGAICAECPNACTQNLCDSGDAVDACRDQLGDEMAYVEAGSTRYYSCATLLAASTGVTCAALRQQLPDACPLYCKDCLGNEGLGVEYCGLEVGESTSSTLNYTETSTSTHPCPWGNQGGAISYCGRSASPVAALFAVVALFSRSMSWLSC